MPEYVFVMDEREFNELVERIREKEALKPTEYEKKVLKRGFVRREFLGRDVSKSTPIQINPHDGLGLHHVQLSSGFIGEQIITLSPAQGDPKSPHLKANPPVIIDTIIGSRNYAFITYKFFSRKTHKNTLVKEQFQTANEWKHLL